MKRRTVTVPGWDCIRHPCGKNGCGTFDGSNHGVHCDEWLYVVSDGDVALSLSVMSGVFPASVPPRPKFTTVFPDAHDLSLHTAWPTDREAILRGERGDECDWVDGGRCFRAYSASLAARDFAKEHWVASAGHEQPESFWVAMEARFAELAADARKERADTKWSRCMHCDGMGTVLK